LESEITNLRSGADPLPNPLPAYREREPRRAPFFRRTRAAILLAPTWLVLGVFFLAPLAIVLLYSFAKRGTYGGFAPIDDVWAWVTSGNAFRNYARSLQADYLRTFGRSLGLATLTTVLCVVVSFPMAYYLAILAPARRRTLLVALVVAPFWTSFLIRTYAWMILLRPEGLINTLLLGAGLIERPLEMLYTNFAVTIGLVYGELPFMILPLYASLEKLDRSLLEASADLGAGTVSTFFRVTVPLAAPGLAAGIVLVFVPSVGQFVVSDLLGGGKVDLLGNVIQRQFTTARDKPFGAALAVELTLLVLAMLAAYAIYVRRKGAEVAL
jgi:spermidine/putrescine transport system permease protein